MMAAERDKENNDLGDFFQVQHKHCSKTERKLSVEQLFPSCL